MRPVQRVLVGASWLTAADVSPRQHRWQRVARGQRCAAVHALVLRCLPCSWQCLGQVVLLLLLPLLLLLLPLLLCTRVPPLLLPCTHGHSSRPQAATWPVLWAQLPLGLLPRLPHQPRLLHCHRSLLAMLPFTVDIATAPTACAGLTRLELSYCGEEGLYSIPTNLS